MGTRNTMGFWRLVSLLVVIAIAIPAVAADNPAEQMDIVKEMDLLSGLRFRSPRVARLVNNLRHLGKKRALLVVQNYEKANRGKYYDDQLILICRLVFEEPSGWEPPRFGAPSPSVSDDAMREFKEFPIAFSKGIPFLVVEGFTSNGRGELLSVFLKRHKNMRIRRSDIPETGFGEAALLLVESNSFKHLYPDDYMREQMATMIVAQADVHTRGEERCDSQARLVVAVSEKSSAFSPRSSQRRA